MTTPLRQKMIEDMQLNGLAARTQESYLCAVRQLARHYQKTPDRINEEELREYFLFLKNDRHASRSTWTINLCGIKFFSNTLWAGNGNSSNLYARPKRRSCR